MAAIRRDVEHCHVSQRIISGASVLHQPAGELLDSSQVVVAGLDASAILAQLLEESLNSAGRQVSDERRLASLDDLARSERDKLDLLRANSLGLQVSLEVGEMVPNGPFPIFIESVHDPSDPALNLLDQFVQHGLGGGLVRGERNAPFGAVLVPVTAPPFLRLRLDLLPGFRLDHYDWFLVQTCHCPLLLSCVV